MLLTPDDDGVALPWLLGLAVAQAVRVSAAASSAAACRPRRRYQCPGAYTLMLLPAGEASPNSLKSTFGVPGGGTSR